MANVRIDANGIPKAAVYEWTAPAVHRTAVTAVDAADPADASAGVNPEGYERCRLDIAITGSGLTSLSVQLLFWNSRQSLWFGGDSYTFTALGRYALEVECRGAVVFLKVTAFSGSSFSLSADYCLS